MDYENWYRRESFYYFTKIAPTTYSLTSNLDVTSMKKTINENGLKFFPSFLWLTTTLINRQIEFRVAIKDNQVGYHSFLIPFYPTFHEEDHSISMLWTEYSPSLLEFHQRYCDNQHLYGSNKGFLAIRDKVPPENAYTISLIPWQSFSSFSISTTSPHPYFFPSI